MSILSRLIGRRIPKDASEGSNAPVGKAPGADNPHTVTSFDTDLTVLANMVADMGIRAGRALTDAARALTERNIQLAQQVIASDRGLDLLQHEIEQKALTTLARRQPVAIDLRQVVSAMRIAADLERIGDLAKNIAKRVQAIDEQPSPANLAAGLARLSERVGQQLSAVLKAYGERNERAVIDVWRADSDIDAIFTSLFRDLLTHMMEDPRGIGLCTHLLFCAKNLERIGDHATNIAETAHYFITGEILTAERPKADESTAIEPSLRSAPT